MEDNENFSSRSQKVLQIRNSNGGKRSIISSSSFCNVEGSAAISLNREGTGASQIWTKLWDACVKFLRSSLAHSEVPLLVRLSEKRGQTERTTPVHHHKPVHSSRQQHLPLTTSLQIAHLKRKLKQRELTARAEAARALGELRELAPVRPLLKALHDEQRFVRAEAARALGKLGERVPTDPLIEALNDEDGSVRAAAAQALGMLGRPASLDNLLQALTDPWPPVREATVLALGKLEEKVPLETFLFVLPDEDKFVRAATLSVLGTLGERVPMQRLVDGLGDAQKMVREAAIKALVALRERAPIELLEVAQNNMEWPAMSEAATRVLSMLANVVPETASPDSKPHFVKIMTEEVIDSHKKHPLKIITSRLVVPQFVQFTTAYIPNWVRENTVVLIVVCIGLGVIFLVFQKKRISSTFIDSTSHSSSSFKDVLPSLASLEDVRPESNQPPRTRHYLPRIIRLPQTPTGKPITANTLAQKGK